MNLADLTESEFRQRITGDGLALQTGPLHLRLRSDVLLVQQGVRLLYADYPVLAPERFCDHGVEIVRAGGLRRWLRPQVLFLHDGAPTFEPMPADHGMPLLEWALNWAISGQAHQYLILHAAVIERGGRAVVMPAPPGSGKSTLCAGLIHRGWRLLSDELALIDLGNGRLAGPARPVSLKNASIDLIAAFAPEAVFGRRTPATVKGTVAHLRAPSEHVRRAAEPALPGWIVFPKYVAGAAAQLGSRPKADAIMQLSRNAFNAGITGREGFAALARLVSESECLDFSYSSLDEAAAVFERLAAAA